MDLQVKIFADGADLATMRKLAQDPIVRGFTTNPTLMRKAGVADYETFARLVLDTVGHAPVSYEVLSDDFDEMRRQARKIASWGENVYVKIPVTNSLGLRSDEVIRDLSADGVKLNVTAVMTLDQVAWVARNLSNKTPSVVSVFAGRIADSGRDPVPLMTAASAICRGISSTIDLLWASSREVLNIVQADRSGCDIITVTPELLAKLPSLGRGLDEFSLDTVRMFKKDAEDAGFKL